FLHLHFVDVCCLQETKLDVVTGSIWREIGGTRLDKFLYLPARGLAGGIIIGWNSFAVTGSLAFSGMFSLSIDFKSISDSFCWRCTAVYGPNARSAKVAFWEELNVSFSGSAMPWVVCGDFNAIFAKEDKACGVPNWEDIRQANAFTQQFGLFEPPLVGRMFTWTNGQANPLWVKLDRFLVNNAWALRIPRLAQNCLPRVGSDHVPIRLEVGKHRSLVRPFRFELVWLSADGFQDIVKAWWVESSFDGCGAFIVSKKLSCLREKLRHWAKFSFRSIKLRKLALLNDLNVLDVAKESRTLDQAEQNQELFLHESLGVIHKQEELYWKQRSRLQWLREGDENTKFFHAVANGRKNRNAIPRIEHDGRTCTNPKDIGTAFAAHFKNIFGRKRDFRFQEAVFNLGSDKAPGPDGFPLQFFKSFWDTIKGDLFKLCEDFYTGSINLERVNWANITLIPKVSAPESTGDFRPISLINSSLKIISKILAIRLSKVLSRLVDGV
ncbi:RNA-directed DNA polymerase protein, partial [Dioscorea alata]